jgi:formate hydrogenlyase subunit 3/multisubunit Na+/H+ antiporter MnhD subunit
MLVSLSLFILRLYSLNSISKTNLLSFLNKTFLSFILYLFMVMFITLNSLLNYYHDLLFVSIETSDMSIMLLSTYSIGNMVKTGALTLNIVQVYYYPFIYVFILITLLSVLFCLSYNKDEFISFIFYCKLILLSGYILFFTNSLILFFLFYEMLLIPSFFILYKFAKTRRCVEAAYLMFFWTQFGALFLIFALLYIFYICGTSYFSLISYFHFSTFEVNFIFICVIIGFGVKLPIWPFYG